MGCHHSDANTPHRPSVVETSELSYFSTTNILRAALVAAITTCDASLTHAILTRKPQFLQEKIRDVSLVVANCTDARCEVLRVVLGHGANADDGLDDGVSALHVAVMANQVGAVKVLLEYGASLNAPMRTPGQPLDGMTPLHLAARQGFEDVVQALVECEHLNVHAVDAQGYTAVQLAVSRPVGFPAFRLLHSLGWVSSVIQDPVGRPVPLLVLAIRPDNLPTIQYLLKYGHKERIVDVADRQSGVTPLMVAAAEGLLDIVDVLIEQGASVNAMRTIEPVNSTALFEAAYNGHHDIVTALLRAGAQHDVLVGDHGMTALHAACSHGHLTVIEQLCYGGANVNATSRHRQPATNPGDDTLTPMHLAALDGQIEVVDVLIKYGATVDACSANGATPLLLAAAHGHTMLALHLIELSNVDLNHRDRKGSNALDVAVAMGHVDTTRILLDHGMDPNAIHPESGQTPREIAELCGFHEIVTRMQIAHVG